MDIPNYASDPNEIIEFSPAFSKKYFGSELRLGKMGVHGDGSCYYHTVCLAMNLEDYVHQNTANQKDIAYRYRCGLAKKLDEKTLKRILKKDKSPTRDEIKKELCNPRTWANETAIRLFADTTGINVIFIDLQKDELYCGIHNDDAFTRDIPDTIVVLWVTHSHFEPLVQLLDVGAHVATVKAMFKPMEDENDNILIKGLMSKYSKQCQIRKRH